MVEIINRVGKYLQEGRSWYTRNVSDIKDFTIHHSASIAGDKTDDQILQELMNDHINPPNSWPGLSYHYVIIRGKIYQINEHEWITWQDTVNNDSLGICVVGYFHEPYNEQPSPEDLQALGALLDELSTNHPEFPAAQENVLGHRERFATACPGDNLFPYVKEYREKKGAVAWKDQATDIPVPAAPPPAPGPELKYSEEQYQAVITARDEANKALQEKSNELVEVNKNYTGFTALGYNTITDVQNALGNKDDLIIGLEKQIVSLKTQLAGESNQFASNQKEEAAAIDHAIEVADELKNLRREHESFLIALGARSRNIIDVLSHIDNLKAVAEKAVDFLQRQNKISSADAQRIKEKGTDWLATLSQFLAVTVIVIGIVGYLLIEGGWR